MEKISKRASAIEEVNNNVKLLTEMVMNHSQGGAAARSSEDLMKVHPAPPGLPTPTPVPPAGLTCSPCRPQELYQRCERMRPTLFRLASDTEDNDEALGELQLDGATTRGPPPPFSSSDLGFLHFEEEGSEAEGLTLRKDGPSSPLADISFTACKLHRRGNCSFFTAGVQGGKWPVQIIRVVAEPGRTGGSPSGHCLLVRVSLKSRASPSGLRASTAGPRGHTEGSHPCSVPPHEPRLPGSGPGTISAPIHGIP